MIPFPANAQIICFSGDWHMNTKYATSAIYWARKQDADVIVHTGDFGYNFTDGFLNALEQEAARDHIIVMFVDGNHENFDWLLAQPLDEDGVRRLREHIWHLPRGFRWEWSGVKFLALGGAHSVDRPWRTPGVEWWHQEWISYSEMENAAASGLADVMITHDCPSGVDIPDLPKGVFPEEEIHQANLHRSILATVVNAVQPSYLFHGHYHVNYVGVREQSNTMVYGLNCDGHEFHQNMVIWRIGNLKKPVDK